MNWTAEDFQRYLDTDFMHKVGYYKISDHNGFFSYLWYEAHLIQTDFGLVERVEISTDYSDGQEERTMIIKIGDRYFKKVGYYDSWNSSNWDGSITEVVPREKTITVYDPI